MLAFRPHIARLPHVLTKTWTRNLSASVANDYTTALVQRQPSFLVRPSNVEVLTAPSKFYSTFLDMIRQARQHIFISSLYIGAEDTELISTLHSTLASNSSLRLHIHLDLNRSTRPGPSSPAKAILPLIKDYPERVNISLFRSPKLKGLLAKLVPPRFNEGWGTWHPKIYSVDNDVMISGANLNSSYFTNRQDRYLRFKAHPELAQYCRDFLERSASFSYRLLPSSTSSYELHWSDPQMHPHHIESKAQQTLQELQSSWLNKRHSNPVTTKDTILFPLIQGGQFDIREEEECLSLLFRHLQSASSTASIDITSGYFGLYKKYLESMLQTNMNCEIICASPKANGFYNAHGISGRIPEAYTLLEQRFMNAVRPTAASRVTLSEWEREGWTYHAKGLWIRPTPSSPPILTLFGSTNLNSRSSNLDTELSFLLTIPATGDETTQALREHLRNEVDGLKAFAVPWRGESRSVRVGTKILVGLGVGGML